jgi:dehydrogenase/reductase SDR family protein 7B
MKIHGKTAWITGASSGIGEALAVELFRKGATVILSARNLTRLNELKERLDGMEQGRCYVVPCDVTLQQSIDQAILKIKHLPFGVDILINNAGVSQRSAALETNLVTVRDLFEVNFFGAVAVTGAILPWMISRGGGHVVVISSMAGKYGFRMRSSYSASKHALHGYFETLRAEVHDKHVKVTMVCPGRVKTDISIHSLTGDGSLYGKMDKGQANGVPVDKCARIIVHALEKDRKEVFIGGAELFLLAVKRICPPAYYWIVNRASPT